MSNASSDSSVLPDPSALTLESLTAQDGVVVFYVRTSPRQVACPQCGQRAHRIHSHYERRLADLPWQGIPVCFHLTARKFFCDNTGCPRRIFAERVPSVADRYSRKTLRLSQALHLLVYRLGGQTGAKGAKRRGRLPSRPERPRRHLR